MNTLLLIAIWCYYGKYYLEKWWDNLFAVFANDESVSIRLTLKITMTNLLYYSIIKLDNC